jgi:hypothetical protein
MGDDGPGGTLIITNGGSLTCTGDWSAVGYESNSVMVVESGGSASFGNHLWIGFDATGADGTLTHEWRNGVGAGMFGLGWNGGQGICECHQWGHLESGPVEPRNPSRGLGAGCCGTGKVVINGDPRPQSAQLCQRRQDHGERHCQRVV